MDFLASLLHWKRETRRVYFAVHRMRTKSIENIK